MEAEYIALSEVAQEAAWLWNLSLELGFEQMKLIQILETTMEPELWLIILNFTNKLNILKSDIIL